MNGGIRSWLADSLGFPLVTLGRYLAGESPAASDPVADSLRTRRGKSAPLYLIGTPDVPVTASASLTETRSSAVNVTDADLVSWYIQCVMLGGTGTTDAQIGFAMEASYDGLDWYLVPLLFTNAFDGSGPSGMAPTPATLYVTDAGTGAGIGLSDANNTFQRYAMYDMIVRPITLLAGGGADDVAVKFCVPTQVGPYNYVRGVLLPLYADAAPEWSLVAVKVS